MGLRGLSDLTRPGKFAELVLVCTAATVANLLFMSLGLFIFGFMTGAPSLGLRTGATMGSVIGLLGATVFSLVSGISVDLQLNAGLVLGVVLADLVAFIVAALTHLVFVPWDFASFVMTFAIAAGSALIVAVPVATWVTDPTDRIPKLD